MKNIPLHSLVFCVSLEHLNNFSEHERLSKISIQRDLIGDSSRIDISHIVFEEIRHRTSLKLSLGERVAIYCSDLDDSFKQQLAQIATSQGALVIEYDPIAVPAKTILLDTLKNNWVGITIVGDVHGDYNALSQALSWAQARGNFTWFLGDIIDYGKDTLKTMNAVYRAVMDGHASLILGNHERKIARWLDRGNKTMHLSEGNKVTVNAIEKLNSVDKRQWIGRFRSLLAHSSLLAQFNNVTLVHGALHPSFWDNHSDDKAIEQFALYGEGDYIGGKFRLTYKWMDKIPKDQMVFVGHDVVKSYPVVKTGALGGQIVFLDTGCGKGGRLSSADLKFDTSGIHLECFRHY